MGELSKIQWCDATVNFWMGCQKISPGCKFCYMFRDKYRYGQDPTKVTRTLDATFYKALTWQDPKIIFTCSWSDFFIDEADDWRADAWDVIKRTPQHQWLILTKRPERIKQCLPEDWGEGYRNVWLGVSVESQKYIHRVETLKTIPAKIRFISAEPLLEEVDLSGVLVDGTIHWVIIGGESGNENGKYLYREAEIGWFHKIIGDCCVTGVSVFNKQLGTHLAKQLKLTDRHGGNADEWDDSLQIRMHPLYVPRL